MRATTATIRTGATAIGFTLALIATPALARHHERMDYPAYPGGYAPAVQAAFPVDRALAEQCGLHAGSVHPYLVPAGYYEGYGHRRETGLGGALIGGVAGGLIGNRVAGHGDRLIGTAAGAAVGAIAGAAIDRAEDNHRYDDRGPPPPGEGYASDCDAVLPAGYMLVSVPGGQECRDEVVTREEWVPEYVTVPGRLIYERTPPRDKRTKLRRVK
jgi:hypothetical protein